MFIPRLIIILLLDNFFGYLQDLALPVCILLLNARQKLSEPVYGKWTLRFVHLIQDKAHITG